MAKISVDLMGEVSEEVEVTCFTLPGPGVCFTIKTGGNIFEIDLPEKIYAALMERIGQPEVLVREPV